MMTRDYLTLIGYAHDLDCRINAYGVRFVGSLDEIKEDVAEAGMTTQMKGLPDVPMIDLVNDFEAAQVCREMALEISEALDRVKP